MPKFSTKHPDREQVFSIDSFDGGYTEESISTGTGSPRQLYNISNMRYANGVDQAGNNRVFLRQRQGITAISNSALPSSGDVLACTYYASQSKYVLATASKLYYLNGSKDPVEIGSSILDGIPTFTEFNGKLIIHDSGVTKYWDGTTATPVEDTNYGKIHRSFADEVLATGDGSTTSYSGTLDNPPLVGSTLSITFTASTTKTITDDGIGRLTGNVPSASAGSGIVESVTGAVDNGAGLIRLTVTGTGFSDGDEVNVQGVGGVSNATNTYANPTWTISGKTANTIDLAGSTFSGTYTSGGTVSINAISNYTTGAYVFNTDSAPDDGTSVLADYDKKYGAAKSNAGLVRGSRLYTWVDSDNPSRLTYSEVNDEKATDTSTGGGYLDVDPSDGYSLKGALNFQTSLLLMKENSLHRIDGYPDDDDFRVEKLSDDIGCIAHRTPLFEGGIVSFLSRQGWVAMHPSQRYGDIQKGVSLSREFRSTLETYADAYSYTAYNPIDNELWMRLSSNSGATPLDRVYVICLETGGQLTRFILPNLMPSSCIYANGEFLIGGYDGLLYKLDKTSFRDLGANMENVGMQTALTDWGTGTIKKHCREVKITEKLVSNLTYDIDFFKDGNPSVSIGGSNPVTSIAKDISIRQKFNFEDFSISIWDTEAGSTRTSAMEIQKIEIVCSLIGRV